MIGVVGSVRDHMADAWQTVDQSSRLGTIAPMSGRDRYPDRQAERIDSGVDLRGQAAFGSANTGSFKPPF